MSIAHGSASKIGFITETVWGTTPTTPELSTLPVTTFNVNLTRDEFEDTSIRGDRMQHYSLSGNHKVAGDIGVILQPTNFDALFESALSSTWSTNVLKVGVPAVRKSFTFEHAQDDIGVYIPYTGVVVDKVAITMNTTGVVTATFSVVGKDSAVAATSTIDNGLGYTAATEVLPFTHVLGTFKEGGADIGYITSVQFTIDNGYSTNFALGNVSARDLTYSFLKVTGTATAFFESVTLYNKFWNGTPSSLDFTLSNGTQTLEFAMPNVKFTAGTKPVNGSGPVVVTIPFKSLYDGTSGSNLVITRSA